VGVVTTATGANADLCKKIAMTNNARGKYRLHAIALGTIGLIALGAVSVQAHDDGRYANSPLKPWFDGLSSKGGGACCSNADGKVLTDVDWDTKDGHYRVRLDGQWIDVPNDTVITEPIGPAAPWCGPSI
jgi:hypothetical protein